MTSTMKPAAAHKDTALTIGGRAFRSRLLVGTGKYRTDEDMMATLEAGGADVVTVDGQGIAVFLIRP